MFITTCIFAAWHWPALAVQFKRLGFLHWAPWASLAMLTPLLAINYGYHGWASDLLRRHEGQAPETLPVQQLGHAGAILLICVFPAVLEEIAFRGLLQHWLQAALRPLLAIALASALFTVLHFSIVSSPYLFLVGMLMVSTLRFPSFKKRSTNPRAAMITSLSIVLVFALMILFQQRFFIGFFAVYLTASLALNLAWLSGWTKIQPPQDGAEDPETIN